MSNITMQSMCHTYILYYLTLSSSKNELRITRGNFVYKDWLEQND